MGPNRLHGRDLSYHQVGSLAVRIASDCLRDDIFISYNYRAPYVVVVKDRGQTLRFYKASHLRIKADLIRQFLKEEGWKDTPPWSTMYSPGGSRYVASRMHMILSSAIDYMRREWWMEYFAVALAATYNTIIVIPSFVLLLLSGVVAT